MYVVITVGVLLKGAAGIISSKVVQSTQQIAFNAVAASSLVTRAVNPFTYGAKWRGGDAVDEQDMYVQLSNTIYLYITNPILI